MCLFLHIFLLEIRWNKYCQRNVIKYYMYSSKCNCRHLFSNLTTGIINNPGPHKTLISLFFQHKRWVWLNNIRLWMWVHANQLKCCIWESVLSDENMSKQWPYRGLQTEQEQLAFHTSVIMVLACVFTFYVLSRHEVNAAYERAYMGRGEAHDSEKTYKTSSPMDQYAPREADFGERNTK